MSATLRFALRNHGLCIVACSIVAFLILMFVTSVGRDFGDARSGDVVRPESSFSTFERMCFEISRVMTIPVRWFKISDSTTVAVAAFTMLFLVWGTIGYLSVRLLIRTVYRRSVRSRS